MRNTFSYPLLLPQTFNYKYFVVLMVIIRFFHPKLCMTCRVMEGIVHVCMYVCMFVYHTRWHSKEYKAVLGGGGHCSCMYVCMYVCISYKVAQQGISSSAGWWRALCMYVYVIQGGTAQHCRVVEGIMHVCVCHTRWHRKQCWVVEGIVHVCVCHTRWHRKQCWVVEGIVHVCVCHTRWHSTALPGGGGHYACMCMSYKVAQQGI